MSLKPQCRSLNVLLSVHRLRTSNWEFEIPNLFFGLNDRSTTTFKYSLTYQALPRTSSETVFEHFNEILVFSFVCVCRNYRENVCFIIILRIGTREEEFQRRISKNSKDLKVITAKRDLLCLKLTCAQMRRKVIANKKKKMQQKNRF